MQITEPDTFAIRPHTLPQHPKVVADAYRAAGLTAPPTSLEVVNVLEAEPTADDVARRLAREAFTVSDAPAWCEAAIAEIQRAQAADVLRRELDRYREDALRSGESGRMTRQATADLAPAFRAAVKTLTAAAKQLPAEPLDMSAIIDTDATKAAREARGALALMAAIAQVVGVVRSGDLRPRQRDVLLVVDVPEVTSAEVDRLSRAVLNPDDTRAEVERFFGDVDRHGIDVSLIRLARGEYAAVRLSLAGSKTEVTERQERASTALVRRIVDSWGYKATVVEA